MSMNNIGNGDSGILITKINCDGPAYKAGFQLGDKVVAIDGHRVVDWEDFVFYLGYHIGKEF